MLLSGIFQGLQVYRWACGTVEVEYAPVVVIDGKRQVWTIQWLAERMDDFLYFSISCGITQSKMRFILHKQVNLTAQIAPVEKFRRSADLQFTEPSNMACFESPHQVIINVQVHFVHRAADQIKGSQNTLLVLGVGPAET